MTRATRWVHRVIALAYAWGAAVHIGNLLGFGPAPPAGREVAWRLLDVVFLVVDVAALVGLWRGRRWGVVLVVVAAVSQLIMFGAFGEWFASTPHEARMLSGLLLFHAATLAALVVVGRFPIRVVSDSAGSGGGPRRS